MSSAASNRSCLQAARALFYTVVLHDLTERQHAEEQREQALAELQATLESTADGILVTDLAGRIRAFNQRFAQLWAIPPDLLAARHDEAVHAWLRRSVHDGEAYQHRLQAIEEAALLSATDELTLHSGKVLQRVTQPLWQRGQPMGRVYSFRDQSQRIAADRRIVELSHTDALTGLPNRAELAAAVEAAGAQLLAPNDSYALMLVDLDRFRSINDSLGTVIGDHVLTDVTRRIRGCMRQGDLLARVGGDQFVLLIHRCDTEAAEVAAQRVLDAVSVPTSVDGMNFTLTCSIGVAMAPAHGHTLDELMTSAEAAMRRVKDAGRASWRVHNARREEDRRVQMRMDHAMRMALAENRFRLHYQPQVCMNTGQHHRRRGL